MADPTQTARTVEAVVAHARRDVEHRTRSSTDLVLGDALDARSVSITDARPAAGGLSLEAGGFVLRRSPTAVDDFFDLQQMERTYLPEVIALVRDLSGADAFVVLEHVIRGPHSLAAERPDYARHVLGWAVKAHVDGDEATYREWATHVAPPDLAARCAQAAFAVYNVWRPITPVEQKPLAFCDARTVRPDDLIPAYFDGRFPGMADSEYYPAVKYFHLAFQPDQRWYFFADMQPDEVAVFKQWDSDVARPRCVPHSAFNDPTSRPDAVRRQSIEVRVFAMRHDAPTRAARSAGSGGS